MSISCGARTATRAGLALMLLLFCSCGGALPLGAPPIPVPLDPWYGTVGNVLISDRGYDQDGKIDYLWVGFNSSTNWQNFLALHQHGWIGGRVVVDANSPLGFYFDPNTVVSAEVTAEGEQTGLDPIKQNAASFAGRQWNWYVPTVVEKVQ